MLTSVSVVVVVPWLITGSFVLRSMLHAKRKGIAVMGFDARERMRELRKTDEEAERLHRAILRWGIVTVVFWVVGFLALCLTWYSQHLKGAV